MLIQALLVTSRQKILVVVCPDCDNNSDLLEVAQYQSKVTFEEIKGWIEDHLVKIPDTNIENHLKDILADIEYGSQE